MDLQQGIFAVKLCQMEEAYGHLQSRIRVCQGKSTEELRKNLSQLLEEYDEEGILLKQQAEGSALASVRQLAQAGYQYQRQTEPLLRQGLAREIAGNGAEGEEAQAEASALFAEYAIDFATQSMRYALCAALWAMVLQAQETASSNHIRRVKTNE